MNAIVKKAIYLKEYVISIEFADGKVSDVDFSPFLNSDIPSYLKMYLDKDSFKGFKIVNGNIVWGEDWDMIFPRDQLYEGEIKIKKMVVH